MTRTEDSDKVIVRTDRGPRTSSLPDKTFWARSLKRGDVVVHHSLNHHAGAALELARDRSSTTCSAYDFTAFLPPLPSRLSPPPPPLPSGLSPPPPPLPSSLSPPPLPLSLTIFAFAFTLAL